MRNGKKIFFTLLIGAFLFLVFAVYHLIGASRFLNNISAAKEHISAAEDYASDLDFLSAQLEVDQATESIERARSGASFFIWMTPIPWVGDQVKAVLVILDAGTESLHALDQAIVIAGRVYSVVLNVQGLLDQNNIDNGTLTYETLSSDVKAELLRTLHRSLPQLQEAQVSLRLAQQSFDELTDLSVAPQILEAIQPFKDLLPNLIAGVDFLVPFASTVKDIAGVDADRQWLMLFMNDMEIRPGGGFLGVYGLTTLRDGDIVDLNVSDTYAVDVNVQFDDTYQLPPPAPLRDYVGVDKWYFRDANWSPDFPTASRDAVQLLRQEIGHVGDPVPEIHGVFGFTPTFGSWLLEMTGPITVQGETFTSENLAQKLEFEVEFGFVEEGIEFDQRKEIVGDLVDALFERLVQLPLSEYPVLFTLIERGFREKHLALYSPFEDTEQAFEDFGWAGNMDAEVADDVLMVVDANMAALKTDPAVARDVSYSIKKQGGDYLATTAITYRHEGMFDDFTTRYRTYTRVYAPLGSELVSHSGSLLNDRLKNPQLLPGEVTVADDLGFTSFGAFISIEPGNTGTLSFTYKLPQSVVDAIEKNVYELEVFKQIGAQNNLLTLDLDFDKKVRTASPAELSDQFGDDVYRVNTIIDQNKRVVVQFQ